MATNLGYPQARQQSSAAVKPRRYAIVKRLLDLAVCMALLPAVLALMPVIAMAIALDSRGPVFFIQPRIGLHGRPFLMYKFRTMRSDYDSKADREMMQRYIAGAAAGTGDGSETLFKPQKAKAYITRVGHILRKTSLDELPQFINVIKGDMSIVGPRPNVLWEVEKYTPWHRRRLDTLPGITGLAQIHGRSLLTFDAIVRYDIEYIENQSLILDLYILWQTVKAVLNGNGAG